MSIQTAGHGFDHGKAVFLIAQRRLYFEEGAVVGHVERVQRQVVNADTSGDVEPVALGAFQRGQGTGGGDLVGVVARAGHLNEGDIAVQPHPLGHGRDGRQAAQ